jgi:aminoglycoside phosphotransferase (APT) family kinase protein
VPTSADRADALVAAVEVGAAAGFPAGEPVVLQDTNNVVVWLVPHPVVAKVGVWGHSASALATEVEVAAHLATLDTPTARPMGPLCRHGARGLPVSLWARIETTTDEPVDDAALASVLPLVWDGLATVPAELPGYEATLENAEQTLRDDALMGALDRVDLALLRRSFARFRDDVAGQVSGRLPLHGEPHAGNVLVAAGGPVLIDFEGACTGPREWDLACAPPGVADRLEDVDHALLASARLLRSAFVAVWGWAGAAHPTMRHHGEQHLAVLRAAED